MLENLKNCTWWVGRVLDNRKNFLHFLWKIVWTTFSKDNEVSKETTVNKRCFKVDKVLNGMNCQIGHDFWKLTVLLLHREYFYLINYQELENLVPLIHVILWTARQIQIHFVLFFYAVFSANVDAQDIEIYWYLNFCSKQSRVLFTQGKNVFAINSNGRLFSYGRV